MTTQPKTDPAKLKWHTRGEESIARLDVKEKIILYRVWPCDPAEDGDCSEGLFNSSANGELLAFGDDEGQAIVACENHAEQMVAQQN